MTFFGKESIMPQNEREEITVKLQKFCALLLAVVVLCACGDKRPQNAIDSAVMPAWVGDFSLEKRKNTIAEYQKKYIPVYYVNVESDTVTFQLDFEGAECGAVTLTPVDDSVKGSELNTIIDFTGEASVDGKTVTVDISWWFGASDTVRSYKLWSYLFWVKDAEGVRHYYYFRVDYTV